MLITAKARYALRAVSLLAESQHQRLTAETLANHAQIPRRLLSDIMSELRVAGIVRAHRGIDGGYELAVEPASLDVLTVLLAAGSTIGEHAAHHDEVSPAIDEFWRALVGTVRDVAEGITIAHLVADALPGDLRRIAAIEARRASRAG